MKRNQNNIPAGLFVLLGVLLAGVTACGNKENTAPAPAPPVQQQKQVKPVQQQVSSVQTLSTAQQFDFSKRKDPFKPLVIAQQKQPQPVGSLREPAKGALPIHSYEISQFKLIGIALGKDGRAMVTDPEGKGYVLKVGTTIGRNNGTVTAITSAGVTVQEQYVDDNGKRHTTKAHITLPRKQ